WVVTSYTWSSLTIGNKYCFAVAAVTTPGGGTGAYSAVIQASTITAAPTSLASGTITATSIVLTWTAPTTSPVSGVITSYTVQSATYSGSCGSYGGAVTLSSGSAYSGLSAGTAYCFEVAAVDTGGTSAYSTAITNVFTLAGPVTGLSVGTYTTTGMTLTWTNPTGTATDTIQEASYTSSCGSYSTIQSGTLITSYAVTGLTAATPYCFQVAAVTSGGTGAYTATGEQFTLPSAPTTLA